MQKWKHKYHRGNLKSDKPTKTGNLTLSDKQGGNNGNKSTILETPIPTGKQNGNGFSPKFLVSVSGIESLILRL